MSHLSDEQLSMLVDGELSLGAREAASRHLRECVGCSERLDELVEVVAELRLAPAVVWDAGATARVMAGLDEHTARQWSAPIATSLAVAGAVLLALELPLITAAAGVLAGALSVVGAFLPSGMAVSGAVVVGGLVAVALIGPLLAVRLARAREGLPTRPPLAREH